MGSAATYKQILLGLALLFPLQVATADVSLSAAVASQDPEQDVQKALTLALAESDLARAAALELILLDQEDRADFPDQDPLPGFPMQPTLQILGTDVAPGNSARLAWTPSFSFDGLANTTPVLVVNGRYAGPTLCLTAAVHGDELNGIEIVRRILHSLEAESLSGALVGVPIVNLPGFNRNSRYLPDRRDLNRFFPGNPNGSAASRIAHSLFQEVILHCDALVDLHTGSLDRTNLPQLRADLRHEGVRTLAEGMHSMVVLHSVPAKGTLRRAATDAGVPAVVVEAGEPHRLQPEAVEQGVMAIASLLGQWDMYPAAQLMAAPQQVYFRSRWVRTDQAGILLSKVELGDEVDKGTLLGTVTDPISNAQANIHSPFKGRILGKALNQFVMPGYAAFRIGLEPDETLGLPDQLERVSEADMDEAE